MAYLDEPANKLERVAFYGPMCAGKSTAARVLVEEFGYVRFAFADKLKEVVLDLFGLAGKDENTRRVLQTFSADCKKVLPDVWIDNLLQNVYKSATYGVLNVVLDDLRFIHEAEVLKENGFTLIRIDTPEEIRLERVYKLYPNTSKDSLSHNSELEWKSIAPDFTISGVGNDTVKDLDKIFLFRGEVG